MMNIPAHEISSADRFAERLQVCFDLQQSKSLICRDSRADLGLTYASRQVTATPFHLRTHIRRVYFSIRSGHPQHLVAALVDLFLVLRGKGKPLVNRLIDQSAPLLEKNVLVCLRKFADTADFRFIEKLPLQHSVLVNGSLAISPQCFTPSDFVKCA